MKTNSELILYRGLFIISLYTYMYVNFMNTVCTVNVDTLLTDISTSDILEAMLFFN